MAKVKIPQFEDFSEITDPGNLKLLLRDKGIRGLALDIDETLSYTLKHWFSELRRLFGNPENLTVRQLIKKYRYFQHVPYWQNKDAKNWAEKARFSNDLQTELSLIKNSNLSVQRVNEIIPIAVYLTTRPVTVIDGTIKWLKKYAFPVAPIIARPLDIAQEQGNDWKAQTLTSLYPEVTGIIDDHPGLVEKLPSTYKGTVYLYDSKVSPRKDIRVVPCRNWKEVLKEVNLH